MRRLQCERLLSSTEPLLAAVISPSSLGFFSYGGSWGNATRGNLAQTRLCMVGLYLVITLREIIHTCFA